MAEISNLLGETITKIEKRNVNGKLVDSETDTIEQLIFTLGSGEKYAMSHLQDRCEAVSLYDIVGNLDDLIGTPVRMAGAETGDLHPNGFKKGGYGMDDSYTWTFYKLATIKGYVTLRWLGESNGYSPESVDFKRID